jgi:hypothetical protein
MTFDLTRRQTLFALLSGAATISAASPAWSGVEWRQSYDAVQSRSRIVRSSTPMVSPAAAAATEQALARYRDLAAQGGWQQIGPERLRLGSRGQAVVALRNRLIIAGDLDASTLAAREALAPLFGDMADVQLVEQVAKLRLALRWRQVFAQLERGAHVVGGGQAAEHAGFLRQVAHAAARALVHGEAADVLAVEQDLPGVARYEANDHVEAGGLAGAVGPEQADDFAGMQVEAEILDDFALLVAFGERARRQHQLPAGRALGWMVVITRPPSPPLSMLPVSTL